MARLGHTTNSESQVMPFAGLVGKVGVLCPRVLFNAEPVAVIDGRVS